MQGILSVGRFNRILFGAGLVAIALSAISHAEISSASWMLTHSDRLADAVDYGRVDVTANTSTGTVSFHVETYEVAAYGGYDRGGISQFGFNFNNSAIAESVNSWSWSAPSQYRVQTNRSMSTFGSFDVRLRNRTSTYSHDLDFSFTLDDPMLADIENFSILSSGNAGQGNMIFAAYLKQFDASPTRHYSGGSSRMPDGATPVPGAALLGMVGLPMIARLRRYFA